ncbi:MAG: anthranilate phosphoribosyltransferase [Gemmatimonadetes bacterium]|nr:anthranilate phosphoribosyltransferase [Gemmatimonadota bacterium]MYA11377.1 anthranilate phosphoribosyltransferase [Gemmatimonadota bacterium]MYE68585.1 anthranilate phosphoribosyltransferase [Gemmatimonadota bacterium]MYJ67269.1 anthranilate phosphoribosyltransferase [Gemmatimonadota bacterium]
MSKTPAAPDFNLAPLLAKVVGGEDLSAGEAAAAFGHVVSGDASPIGTGALLAALQTKGLAPSEVAGGVEALRGAMIPVQAAERSTLVDTCGTGGGEVSTFNISTAAALVVAAGGVRVAKHGNRSFTSKCGSADVLEALGVAVELTPAAMAAVLAEAGIVFMFAPLLHPAMRHVAPVRRDLGITTIMNLLGPITNPAGARRQVVGVADPAFLELVVRALAELGHERALVVHGEPGLDELSPCGPTRVAELREGVVSTWQVTPGELGLDEVRPRELAGGEPEENAAVVRAVLAGDRGAARTAVLINAAAAYYVAGRAGSLEEGVRAAEQAIDSGAAAAVLEKLVSASRTAA